MNVQNIRPDLDLEKMEKTAMGKTDGAASARKPKTSALERYTEELRQLAVEAGIGDLCDDATFQSTPAPASGPPGPQSVRSPIGGSAIDDLLEEIDLGSSDEGSDSEVSSDESSGGSSDASSGGSLDSASDSSDGGASESGGSDFSTDESGSSGESEDSGSSDDLASSDADSVLSGVGETLGNDLDAARRHGKRRSRVHSIPVAGGRRGGRLARLTEEQERRGHINAVMGEMRSETRTSFGVEHERTQDVKASKLEQIGQLRMTLEEEGVDCTAVANVTMASEVDEIDSVLTILKLKNDRNRYSSIAEELILSLAEGVETVFDGTREVPLLGMRPDYTGYHNTVNVKLHRMRHETSQVVGNIIEKHHIGPAARIVMELLPSFFLYPRQQRAQRGAPGLHSDYASDGKLAHATDMRGAYSAIRRSDTPSALETLSRV